MGVGTESLSERARRGESIPRSSALGWAMRQEGLRPRDKLVLMVIGDGGPVLTVRDGERLARNTGLSFDTAQRVVRKLERRGLLQQTPHGLDVSFVGSFGEAA